MYEAMTMDEIRKMIKGPDIDKPYAFVSYSSKDKDVVYRDVVELQKLGVNLWIDKGLDCHAGKEWDKVALGKMKDLNCRSIIFYLSTSSIGSAPVCAELFYSRSSEVKDYNQSKELNFIPINLVQNLENMEYWIGNKMIAIYGRINISEEERQFLKEDYLEIPTKAKLDYVFDICRLIYKGIFNSSNNHIRIDGAKEHGESYFELIIENIKTQCPEILLKEQISLLTDEALKEVGRQIVDLSANNVENIFVNIDKVDDKPAASLTGDVTFEIFEDKHVLNHENDLKNKLGEKRLNVNDIIQHHNIDMSEQYDKVANNVRSLNPQGIYGFAIIDAYADRSISHSILEALCSRLIKAFTLGPTNKRLLKINEFNPYKYTVDFICNLGGTLKYQNMFVIIDVDKEEDVNLCWEEIHTQLNQRFAKALFIFFVVPTMRLPDRVIEIQKPNYFEYSHILEWIDNVSTSLFGNEDDVKCNLLKANFTDVIEKKCCVEGGKYAIDRVYDHIHLINQTLQCSRNLDIDMFINVLDGWRVN